jgi:D-glycero-D-manno-heptose 1,7-bisphosphate phosphatase
MRTAADEFQITPEGLGSIGQPLRAPVARAGLFLDRDGVVVEEVNYLRRRQDVRLERGAAALVRWANEKAIPVMVTTNQAGIARGLFDWATYQGVEGEIHAQLGAGNAHIDLTLACPFHPDFTPGYGESHAHWRKPGAGMLHLAADRLNVDLSASWFIGDKLSDIQAAKAAGLPGAILVLTGYGAECRDEVLPIADAGFSVEVLPTLEAAPRFLESKLVVKAQADGKG